MVRLGRLLWALMRITGGTARGITLQVPHGDKVRPATDGTRQALFSSLATRIEGTQFLDLFAGSGAYGLEALSRGARQGTFVERNPKALSCLRQNLAAVSKCLSRVPTETATILGMDVLTAPWTTLAPLDLVFIDPPYDLIEEMAPLLFHKLTEALKNSKDPLVMFEMPGEMELKPEGWHCIKRLGRGARQPSVAIFRKGVAK
jgi:16S rRNA (guanine966-N2)-methyltransferase